MDIEFTAFADDAIFSGCLALQADRLSDVIAGDSDFLIRDVRLVALDDGRAIDVASAFISRSDLAAITAGRPRGNPARRFPTRQHPVRTRIGPYEVTGYVHTPPSAHILSGVIRRRVVPLTSATIRYRSGTTAVTREVDVLLLNGDRVTWVEPARRFDLAIGATLDAPARFGRPKDMTGVSH